MTTMLQYYVDVVFKDGTNEIIEEMYMSEQKAIEIRQEYNRREDVALARVNSYAVMG